MEENNRERVEIQPEGEEEVYSIDLGEKSVIIFSGNTYDMANMIPQFLMDCRSGKCGDSENIFTFNLKYFLTGKDIKEEGSGDEIIQFLNADSKSRREMLSGKTNYIFYKDIEYGRSAEEQIEYIEYLFFAGKLGLWKTSDKILISTHSPYVLNYMNVIMAKDQEFAKNISAYYVEGDCGHVHCLDSTCNLTNRRILDTIDLSDPMEYIFERYDEIK